MCKYKNQMYNYCNIFYIKTSSIKLLYIQLFCDYTINIDNKTIYLNQISLRQYLFMEYSSTL